MNSDKQLTKFTNQWFVVLLITIGIASAFYWYNRIIVKNIGQIEFSRTLDVFNSNIESSLKTLEANTYYDFLFIAAYSTLFYLTYRVFQGSMRIPVSKLWILLCIIPGFLDVVENFLILNLIDGSDNTLMFNSFWLTVRAKWTLVIPFVLANITILVYYILRFINSFFS